ncbi:hypothetical protein LX32DRAFT_637118 [Colletotrichum zoysiae]|uniref:Uncharacterized protein n=1 Tax=Colletotrichum zoysiae TaxID=1216348 RepID=A0AAD9M764_9PEZI|nr:hypothetical protein LX32DRAFT_637118 [Colletotrichum zoysiae]
MRGLTLIISLLSCALVASAFPQNDPGCLANGQCQAGDCLTVECCEQVSAGTNGHGQCCCNV